MEQSLGALSISYETKEDLWILKSLGQEGSAQWHLAGPELELTDGTRLKLADCSEVTVEPFERGRGDGLTVRYTPHAKAPLPENVIYCCRIWQPAGEEGLVGEWWTEGKEALAAADSGTPIQRLYWPRLESLEAGDTILPWQQGQLIPHDWPEEIKRPPFDGQFCTAGAYMPWIGQTNESGMAWQMIAETPWDGGYTLSHPAGGPTTDLAFYWLPSLGAWRYPRKTRIYLVAPGCNLMGREVKDVDHPDYNHLAKRYRRYAKERGIFTSIEEKIARNPRVDELIGASVVHLGIKSHTEPDSRFYQKEAPELNDALVTFAERQKQMEALTKLGAPKFYLHLDGWGEAGYDNCHPDYLPISSEAGGPEGLRALVDTVQSTGNLFGLHDQYRDYYFKAKSFDPDEAITTADGTHPEHANWAGGRQTYLCASLAKHYVYRNFAEIFAAGIRPDCSYLDVFTCNEPDECFHPEHPMTRRDCLDARLECFAWLNSQGIAPSSEEMNEWAIRELVFCHYAPYSFMLDRPGSPRPGLAIPLWNLVYHDAALVPWPTDPADDTHEDYLLYALLNAGMPYLIREGAYPGVDGAFADSKAAREQLQEAIGRAEIATQLHRRLALTELLEHRFLTTDGSRQRCRYADGTVVTVDLKANTYEITSALKVD